jgi:UDP-glucose 4-epimerase
MDVASMKVLVTGATGFIGKHLVQKLMEKEEEVLCVSRQTSRLPHTVYADLTKKKDLDRLPSDVDCIFHLAAYAPIPDTEDDPSLHLFNNTLATLNILEYAKERGIENVIYASTMMVYGKPQYLPIDEAHPVTPNTFYGASKYGGEILCNIAREKYCINTVNLRLNYVYGPYMSPNTVIHKFLTKSLEAKTIEVFNGGQDTFDFIYVGDVVQACLKSIGKKGTFNIGSGIPNNIIDLAEIIVDSTGSNSEIVIFEQESDQEVRQIFCSIEKAQIELGYRVNYPLEEGIKSYINFLCSQVKTHTGV